MAKQTFTTGQVLTAAQMTSLQQTAMGGGDTTAKTVSYVLVAADAGTVVAMNAAGATTITVNTSLFSAGDTVFIQNRGAGVCTITAGTATVSTAGSLALSQHEGGILYFTATGAAIFYDYVQTGAVSPLTTKGDIWGYSTLDARIPIGTNNQVLTADSSQALGLKWATPTAAGLTYSNATVATSELTSSSSFTDLTTAGPAVTVTTGTSALVIVRASISTQSADRTANMGFAVSGSTTTAASTTNCFSVRDVGSQSIIMASAVIAVTLTAGSNTFTAKYSTNGSECRFSDRNITVIY